MTSEEIAVERARVVAEALSWQFTPFHWHARVKGAGVDCCTLLIEVFKSAQLLMFEPQLPQYTRQFFMHKEGQLYEDGLKAAGAVEITHAPEPGDIALYMMGLQYAHGAIVLRWPEIVCAYAARSVVRINCERDPYLSTRARKFYSPARWQAIE